MPFDEEGTSKPQVDSQTLSQEDFIEYILKHTDDVTSEFRVYTSKNYITVGIDGILSDKG